MAKPIRATPTLTQNESKIFVKKMLSVEKRKSLNKGEQFFIKSIFG